jgi:hypothetical protein
MRAYWMRCNNEVLKHDAAYNTGGYVRKGLAATDDLVSSEGVYHALVRMHLEPADAPCISADGETLTSLVSH